MLGTEPWLTITVMKHATWITHPHGYTSDTIEQTLMVDGRNEGTVYTSKSTSRTLVFNRDGRLIHDVGGRHKGKNLLLLSVVGNVTVNVRHVKGRD